MECTRMTKTGFSASDCDHHTSQSLHKTNCACSRLFLFCSGLFVAFLLAFFFCFFFKSRKEKQQEIPGGCSPVMPGAHYGLPNIKSQSRYKLARRRQRRRRRQGRDSAPAARHRHPFSYAVSHTEFRTSPPSLLRHTYTYMYVYMVLHMYTTEYKIKKIPTGLEENNHK